MPRVPARRTQRELNFVDTQLTNVGFDTTGSVTLLNGMVQGTTASTRIGRKITMTQIICNLRAVSNTNTLFNDFRMALVLDTQANGAAPAITDIYDVINSTSMRNISNGTRFRILKTWEDCNVGNQTTAGQQTDNTCMAFKYFQRCNITVTYNANNAGTVGDIQTNALYIITMGNQVSGTSNSLLYGTVRIRYTD